MNVREKNIMKKIYFTGELKDVNQFSLDGKYNEEWVSIKIDKSSHIKLEQGIIYGCSIGRKVKFWEYRVMDYINYNLMYGRNVIFVGNPKMYKRALKKYGDRNIYDKSLRPYEEKVIIHSTTFENYVKIKQQGVIKCWNILKKENETFEDKPIGALLDDPEDFSKYIMFGSGVQCEIVVLSKQRNKLCYDINEEYIPGARMYFSAQQLASDGLLIRDGLHYKVKNELSLDYALFIATIDNVHITGNVTPKSFTEAADTAFRYKFGYHN